MKNYWIAWKLGTATTMVGNAAVCPTPLQKPPAFPAAKATTRHEPVYICRSIHDILSSFKTNWSVVPTFGGDYNLSEVDNGWWMAHETDFNLGHNSERMTDNDLRYTDTDLRAWVLGFSSLPPCSHLFQ